MILRDSIPRSPLLIKVRLDQALPLVKLAIIGLMPGKRYFPASPTEGNSDPVFCVVSNAAHY